MQVVRHYQGLRDAVPGLRAFALLDRLDQHLPAELKDVAFTWSRREIENYACPAGALEAYAAGQARAESGGPLFEPGEVNRRVGAMRSAIRQVGAAMETLEHGSRWDEDTKVSDHFLTPLFKNYFKLLSLPNLMAKKNFHELAEYVSADALDPEVRLMLERIVAVSQPAGTAD